MTTIEAFMFRIHIDLLLFQIVTNITELLCSVQQEPIHQKMASIWADICSTSEFFRFSPILLTFYVQYTKIPTVKSSFHLST